MPACGRAAKARESSSPLRANQGRVRPPPAVHRAHEGPEPPDRAAEAHGHGELVVHRAPERRDEARREPAPHQHEDERRDPGPWEPRPRNPPQEQGDARRAERRADEHRHPARERAPGQEVEREVEDERRQDAKVDVVVTVVVGDVPEVLLAARGDGLLAQRGVVGVVDLREPRGRLLEQGDLPGEKGAGELVVAVRVVALAGARGGVEGAHAPALVDLGVVVRCCDAGVDGLCDEHRGPARHENRRRDGADGRRQARALLKRHVERAAPPRRQEQAARRRDDRHAHGREEQGHVGVGGHRERLDGGVGVLARRQDVHLGAGPGRYGNLARLAVEAQPPDAGELLAGVHACLAEEVQRAVALVGGVDGRVEELAVAGRVLRVYPDERQVRRGVVERRLHAVDGDGPDLSERDGAVGERRPVVEVEQRELEDERDHEGGKKAEGDARRARAGRGKQRAEPARRFGPRVLATHVCHIARHASSLSALRRRQVYPRPPGRRHAAP